MTDNTIILTATDAEAVQLFEECLDKAFQPGASGGVFAYQWVPGDPAGPYQTRPDLVRITEKVTALEKAKWKHVQMFIIDSGDNFGDSWKLIYHAGMEVATFIQE